MVVGREVWWEEELEGGVVGGRSGGIEVGL